MNPLLSDSPGVFSSITALAATTTSAPFMSTISASSLLHPIGNTTKCLDVRGGIFQNGTPVQRCASSTRIVSARLIICHIVSTAMVPLLRIGTLILAKALSYLVGQVSVSMLARTLQMALE